MLSLSGYRLVLWNSATDMRLSFNGLSGLVINEMKEDPFQYGTLYAFFNHRRTQVKMLLLCKHLHNPSIFTWVRRPLKNK